MQALDGVRVIDMTRVVAGPLATQSLGDLGAEVIKLERPLVGDDVRYVGPPWLQDENGPIDGASTYFQTVNRNKRSVTVDFTKAQGADLVRSLASRSQVFVENFRTGTLAKYGLDYETLRSANPSLVYCSITGFGQSGPYAERSGYDYLVQAMGGAMALTGVADGSPGAGPMRVGLPLADIFAGHNATSAILAALRHAERTGEGQAIDISLLDSQVAALLNPFAAWLNNGQEIGRSGNDHPSAAPYGPFETASGHILLATFNDREFARVANVVGHPEWAEETRFAKSSARVANRRTLAGLLGAIFSTQPTDYWVEKFNEAKISCGPINSMSQVAENPQVLARDMIVTMPHPTIGEIRMAASPLKLGRTPPTYRLAPPLVGADTDAVLRELLELDSQTIAALRKDGVL
jgi:crotonobetainyl-CoA:carnitine CoA-transferase CaiB-like acyl-CoA transferase